MHDVFRAVRIQLRRDMMQHGLHVGPATGFG